MKNFFTKNGIILLSTLTAIAVVLCIVSAASSGTGFIHNALGVIASPFRAVGGAVSGWVSDVGDYFDSLEALQDEQWDIIFMQSGCRKGGTGTIFNDDWKVVADYLMNNQDIAPKLAHHFSWANPDDYELYLNDDAPYNHPTNPTSYRKTLEKYYSVDGKFNQLLEYQLGAKYTKQYLYDTHDVMGREFDFLVSNATAIQYAHEVCGRPLPELYRDYTHLNDFARVIASYHMYAAIMGIDQIDQVKMTTIPVALKHKNSQYPVADANGEYKLDAQMQADIIASVNWALANPFSLPETN
jgi:hypothetical protein